MAELAVLGSPGQFKAKKKDPERMLADFNLYVKAIKNLMILTDNSNATDAKKKALMQSVGGQDIVWLFEYVGKVLDGDTYDAAITKIRAAITGQTNQAVMKYKLFTGMKQEDQSFASWWTAVKEQADKCDFQGYNHDKAARDAILFQTSNDKLRKRILAEDQELDAVVKLGMSYEQSAAKAKDMSGSKTEQRSEVCRIQQLQEQVARLQADFSKSGKKDKVNERTGKSCQTCPQGSRHEGKPCLGKKAKECYGCKEAGHFKGAPICKAKEGKKEKRKQKKVRQLKDVELSETNSDSSGSDSDAVLRVKESNMVAAAKEETSRKDVKVQVKIRPKLGGAQTAVNWLADSGVSRTLLAEADWNRIKQENPTARLKRNKVHFTPYGTNIKLPVKGRAKVVLTNVKGRTVTSMVYVVEEQTESLLGKKDGQALGIIQITPEGGEPGSKTTKDTEEVHRMTDVKKTTAPKNGIISGGQT
jgi:hypothetical protein